MIGFESGTPVSLDGETALAPRALLARLNRIAGAHGVGRVDMVENRFVGLQVARRLRDAGRHACCTPRTARSSRSRSTAR